MQYRFAVIYETLSTCVPSVHMHTYYYIAVLVHTTSIEQTLELHTYIQEAHSRALSHEWSSPIFFPCFLVKSFVYNSLYSGYLACNSTCYALHGPGTPCAWSTYLPTYIWCLVLTCLGCYLHACYLVDTLHMICSTLNNWESMCLPTLFNDLSCLKN